MALVACKECGEKISHTANQCPRCGFKSKTILSFLRNLCKKIFLLALIVMCIFYIGFMIFKADEYSNEISEILGTAQRTPGSEDTILKGIAKKEKTELNNNPQIKGKGLTCEVLSFEINEGVGRYKGYGLLSDGTRFSVGVEIKEDDTYYFKCPLWLRIDELQKEIKEWVNKKVSEEEPLNRYELTCTDLILYKDTEVSLKGYAIFKDLQKVSIEVNQTEDGVVYSCAFNELDLSKLELNYEEVTESELSRFKQLEVCYLVDAGPVATGMKLGIWLEYIIKNKEKNMQIKFLEKGNNINVSRIATDGSDLPLFLVQLL